MSRASEGELDALHAAVAKVLIEALRPKIDHVQGEAPKITPPSPQMVAQAIKFLMANGIDAPAKSERLTGLAAALEDLDLDEVAEHLPN